MQPDYESIDTVKVLGNGIEEYDHRNVTRFSNGDMVDYRPDGDVSLNWGPFTDSWVTLPVKTQKAIVMPMYFYDGSSTPDVALDQTIVPDGEEEREIGGKKYKMLRFLINASYKELDNSGAVASKKEWQSLLVWVPQLGYTALRQVRVSQESGIYTLLGFELR